MQLDINIGMVILLALPMYTMHTVMCTHVHFAIVYCISVYGICHLSIIMLLALN